MEMMHGDKGTIINVKGRRVTQFLVVISGKVNYNDEKIGVDMIKDYKPCFQGGPGDVISGAEILLGKPANYTIITDTSCIFLSLSANSFVTRLKKYFTERNDMLIRKLSTSSLFNEVGKFPLKHHLSYFVERKYKYHDYVFQEGSPSKMVYFILSGEIELIQDNKRKPISIVNKAEN